MLVMSRVFDTRCGFVVVSGLLFVRVLMGLVLFFRAVGGGCG